MSLKPGDIVWYETGHLKATILEFVGGRYKICYLNKFNTATVRYVKKAEICQYLPACPVCGKTVLITNGLIAQHGEETICYGSFLTAR